MHNIYKELYFTHIGFAFDLEKFTFGYTASLYVSIRGYDKTQEYAFVAVFRSKKCNKYLI